MKQILSTSEVADLFGVTPEAVRGWADAGKLPSFRTPGGQRKFHRSKVEAFIAEQEPAA